MKKYNGKKAKLQRSGFESGATAPNSVSIFSLYLWCCDQLKFLFCYEVYNFGTAENAESAFYILL